MRRRAHLDVVELPALKVEQEEGVGVETADGDGIRLPTVGALPVDGELGVLWHWTTPGLELDHLGGHVRCGGDFGDLWYWWARNHI